MALTNAAPATARPHEPKECHRLEHAFDFVAAALLGNKQANYLALDAGCHKNHAWFGQRLHPRRDVGRVAINLTGSINHYRAGFDADACGEWWLARTGILAVDLSERELNRECGPRCTFRIVLLRRRITEQRHQPVA